MVETSPEQTASATNGTFTVPALSVTDKPVDSGLYRTEGS